MLTLLPDPVLEAMSGSVIASDVQASNVPIYPGDTYIAGAKVLRQFGIGPLPGVAMMVVLISRGGFATVTTRYDRAAVSEPDLWARCLREGFDEVLALAGDPHPRVVPASFLTVRTDPARPRRDRWLIHERHNRQGCSGIAPSGSVAEVMASPAGPQVGAFFDVDGTLVAGFTGVILTRERFRSRDMGVGELISMVAAGLNHQFGRMEFEELINKATDVLRGRPLSDLQQIGQRLFSEKIEKRIYPEMRDLVQAHIERGTPWSSVRPR